MNKNIYGTGNRLSKLEDMDFHKCIVVTCPYDLNPFIQEDELKKFLRFEVKKWVKELEKEENGQWAEGKPLVAKHVKEWIKYFFGV